MDSNTLIMIDQDGVAHFENEADIARLSAPREEVVASACNNDKQTKANELEQPKARRSNTLWERLHSGRERGPLRAHIRPNNHQCWDKQFPRRQSAAQMWPLTLRYRQMNDDENLILNV